MKPSILVVDDETTIQETLRWTFESEGYRVATAGSGEGALRRLEQGRFDVLVSDIRLPGIDGVEVLRRARALVAPPVVVLITAHATVETAVDALRHGAADYVLKPFSHDDLKARVRRLLAGTGFVPPDAAADSVPEIIGQSPAIEALREQIRKAAAAGSHVLITGETGTGKDLAARAIHAASARRAERFVAINCGAIPETLFESQLFGHVRGAFTSAVGDQPGLMVAADRGTLFLDEVGELTLPLQVKLLRAIEDHEIWPVGRTRPVRVDCRIIASTNRDLRVEVEAARFRPDLYYRLNVVHLAVPPLRARRADIPVLVEHFLRQLTARLGTRAASVDPEALRVLVAHDWKGNVRELQHVVESALVCGEGGRLTRDALPPEFADAPPETPLKDATRRFERERILETLSLTSFDKREAARRLGLSVSSLYRKLESAASEPEVSGATAPRALDAEPESFRAAACLTPTVRNDTPAEPRRRRE